MDYEKLISETLKGKIGEFVVTNSKGDILYRNHAEDFTDEKGRKWPGARSIQKANGYKENCGTIAVGISDKQIMKMLADPEIQMVIPYHKSSLNPIVAAMTNVDRFTNYEDFQNTKNAEGKTVKTDFAWDKKLFGLTHYTRGEKKGELKPKDKWGNVQDLVKEYVDWCESKNYTPKFSQFLYLKENNDPDGDFVLDENGNKIINPGYYKMLEDFALMDNDGNFKPQGDVRMQFPTAETGIDGMSMESLIERGLTDDTELEAMRSEKIGGIVDEIDNMFNEGTLTEQSVASQKLAQKFSISPEMDDAYMAAVDSGNMDEAQRLVDEAAKMSGLNSPLLYHGTYEQFTTFKGNEFLSEVNGLPQIKGYFSEDRDVSEVYGDVSRYYVGINNPLDFYDVPWSQTESEWRKWFESKGITDIRFDSSIYEDTLKEHINDNGENEYSVFEIFDGADMWAGDGNLTERIAAAGYDGMRWDYDEKAWMPFDDKRIKSADPVTYAEDGSVIPLSERFDPTNNDIRYSLPTQDSDGNILTDGQMEYFKNSQARDIFGRLVPLYHATDEGGFTIFDPWKSDDHRSLFFTNKRDVANTYVEDKYLSDEDRIGSDDNTEERSGYYQVYLNLENPLIIDGQGQPWNNIVDGGSVFPAYSSITLRNRSWFEEEAEGRDKMYELGQSLYNGDNARARAQEFEGDDYVEIEIFNGKKKIKAIIPLTEEAVAEEAAAAFGVDDLELLQGVASEIVGDMEFGNITKIYDDDMRNTIGEYGYNTREWAEFAEDEGHDGVIFRNIIDIDDKTEMFDSEEEAASDVYVAFSSNQVKDINNENPTENPDIRFSITPEDEAKSKIAYDDAMSDSYNALQEYETSVIYGSESEYFKGKAYLAGVSEENISEFFDALKAEDAVPSTDSKFEEDRVRRAKSKEDFYNNVYAKWNDRWTTEGEVLDIKSVKTDITKLVKGVMANSDTDAKYRNEIVRQTLIDVRNAYQLMKQGRSDVASYLLYHSAQRMIDGVEFIRDDMAFKEYKEIQVFQLLRLGLYII